MNTPVMEYESFLNPDKKIRVIKDKKPYWYLRLLENEKPYNERALFGAMSENIFLLGDIHIGDPVDNWQSKRDKIITTINSVVKPSDHLLILGDLSSHTNITSLDDVKATIQMINCKNLYLILGNNDQANIQDYIDMGFKTVTDKFIWKNYIFTHMPEPVMGNDINIHAHIHEDIMYIEMDWRNHINIWDNQYVPIRLRDVLKQYEAGYYKGVTITVDEMKEREKYKYFQYDSDKINTDLPQIEIEEKLSLIESLAPNATHHAHSILHDDDLINASKDYIRCVAEANGLKFENYNPSTGYWMKSDLSNLPLYENVIIFEPTDLITDDGYNVPKGQTLISGNYFNSRKTLLYVEDIKREQDILESEDIVNSFNTYIHDSIDKCVARPLTQLDKNISVEYDILKSLNKPELMNIIDEKYFDVSKYSQYTEDDIIKFIQLRKSYVTNKLYKLLEIMKLNVIELDNFINDDIIYHINDDMINKIVDKIIKDGIKKSSIIKLSEYGCADIYLANAIHDMYSAKYESTIPPSYNMRQIVSYALDDRYDVVVVTHGIENPYTEFKNAKNDIPIQDIVINNKTLNKACDVIDELINMGYKNILMVTCNTNPNSVRYIQSKYGNNTTVNVYISSTIVIQETTSVNTARFLYNDTKRNLDVQFLPEILESFISESSNLKTVSGYTELFKTVYHDFDLLFGMIGDLCKDKLQLKFNNKQIYTSYTTTVVNNTVISIREVYSILCKVRKTLKSILDDIIRKENVWYNSMIKNNDQLKSAFIESVSIQDEVNQAWKYSQIEETLKRSQLPDSEFGVPQQRKFPLDTKMHVISAIKLFNHVDPMYEKTLATNIKKKMKEFGIENISVGPKNRFVNYCDLVDAPTDKELAEDAVDMTMNIVGIAHPEAKLVYKCGKLVYALVKKATGSTESLSVVTEAKTYKLLTEDEIKSKALEFTKSSDENIRKLGTTILDLFETTFDIFEKFFGVVSLVLIMGVVTIDILIVILSVISILIVTLPFDLIKKVLKSQIKFLRGRLKPDPIVKNYYSAVNTILKTDMANTVQLESLIPVLEAPKADDDDEDDDLSPEDFTEDAETHDLDEESEEEPEDFTTDAESDEEMDEPEDFTEDTDSETSSDDSSEDDTTDDELDDTPNVDDEDDTQEEPEDFTEDAESDDETPESSDDIEDEDDDLSPEDFTEDTDSETSSDDSSEDDTTDDESSEMGETDDTSMTETGEDNNNLQNSIVKNYNLIIDFKKLHKSIEDILQHLKSVVYSTSLQQSILSRCVDNMVRVKDELDNYIECNFSKDYKVNLYYYNIYIQALKINLEMLRRIGNLDKDGKQ